MGEIVNPYIAGAPVIEQRMFFGREDIFQWIENSITGQFADHILVVHGQRRVGKTSVLKQLGNRLPKRFIPVFFDLQGRTHTTLDHFLWWLARETVRVLKQERNIEIPPPDKKAFSSDPEFFENQFLTSVRSSLGSSTLLLTFDEFDNLEESEVKEELARPLVDHLRRLMGQPNLNFIFSIGSSGRKLENMQAAYTDFFKTALYKKISFLGEEQTHNLVTRPVAGIIEYERAAVERIYRITSGHPYFTQLTCHELFARCQRTEQRKIAVADVESVLDDVVERGTVNLKFVWDEASDIEKWSLAALAQLDKTDNRTLADFLRKNRVRFSDTDLTSGLLHLREKDVLTPQNHFIIHLLRIWLQKNRPIEQAREELTEANPIASRFIEIGLEFREGGQHDKAIEFFRQALSISADNLQAQVNIALTYAAQGMLEQAVTEFEKALKLDDEDVASRSGLCDAYLAMGDAAIKRGRAKDAILSYQRVLAINAEHLEARQRMAELSRQRAEKALTNGKDEEALSAFAEALKFTPEDQTLIERSEKVRAEKNAKVLAEQISRSEKEAAARNWEKAIEALNAALEIAPGDKSILKRIEGIQQSQLRERLDAILSKVDAAEKTERWDAAIGGLNEYLQWKPDDAVIQKRITDLVEAKHAAWLNGVMTRVERAASAQNWDEALTALNEALRLEPDNSEIQARAEQVREMRRVAELNARLQRADQAVEAGRWDEAIDILNDGLASDPENETLKTKLAEARKARREARLQAALRFAESAAQAGKWEAAIASLNEVLANEPDNIEFQQKLAEVRTREHQSQWQAARTQSEGLREAERFAEALQVWQDYLSIHPKDCEQVEKETKPIAQERELFDLYTNAEESVAARDFDPAIRSLKEIILRDENYKDASRLLTKAIESRRTGNTQKLGKSRKKPASPKPARAPKTGGKWTWVIGGLAAILILGIGGGLFWLGKNGLPAMPAVSKDNTKTLTSVATRAAPTLTPIPTLDPELQSALDTIQSEEPLYQTSFDDWDFGDPVENASIENGKLIVLGGENQSTYVSHTSFQSDRFAIKFETQILESGQGGACLLNIGSDDEYSIRNIFMPSGDMEVDHLEVDGYEITIGNGQFDPSNVSTTTLIVLNDQISLFVDGKLAFTAHDPEGSAVYTNLTYEADSHMKCGFDNFKFWDLREMDSAVKTALATIQSEEPLYQTSFDDWDTDDTGRNAALVNGKLILTSEDENGATLGLNTYPSDRFAVEFEFRILESGSESHCVLETFNDGIGKSQKAISAGFFSDGEMRLVRSVDIDTDTFEDIAVSRYDETKSNTVTLFILGDQITAFVNGQIAYTALNPNGSVIYTRQQLSAYNTIGCEFDNFKYWDLREMDSAVKTALATIQNEEPLYQTSFDGWESWGSHGTTKVENGKLIVASENQQHAGVNLYNLTSDKYAVQFDLRILDISSLGHCIFESSNNLEYGEPDYRGLSAGFFSDGNAIPAHYIYPDRYEDFEGAIGKYDLAKSNAVTLIVLGNQIAAFVDGNLIYTVLDPAGSALFTNQGLSANYTAQCEYDDFKIWDLSEMDSAVRIALAAIQSEEPLYQTSFDTWDFGNPVENARVENGKLIVSSPVAFSESQHVSVTLDSFRLENFAAEFEFRGLNPSNDGHCIFYAENDGNEANYSQIAIGFHKAGGANLTISVQPAIQENLADSLVDISTTNKITFLVIGEQIFVLKNGQLMFNVLDPRVRTVYTHMMLAASHKIDCEYDNYKIWDLSSVDFNP